MPKSLAIFLVAVAAGAPARATAAPPAAQEQQADSDVDSDSRTPTADLTAPDWTTYAPAAVDVPQIRNLQPQTRLYFDAAYARSDDLSALPYVEGKGHNLRATIGGSLKLNRFQFDIELPAGQATTLDVTRIPGGEPIPADAHQQSLSIGDFRAGAQWTTAPFHDVPFLAGIGLRGRFPTHTVRFKFHLANNSIGIYAFPYYFHIEPAVLLGGAFGPISFVMNQGPIVLTGPDADFEDIHFVVPTIYFWDSHYAVILTPHPAFGLSVEFNTVVQMSHVDGLDFMKLNDVRAYSVIPGVQFHWGDYRFDAVGRIGLSKGADLVGVIGYGGTNSITLRVTRFFD